MSFEHVAQLTVVVVVVIVVVDDVIVVVYLTHALFCYQKKDHFMIRNNITSSYYISKNQRSS